jgi:hypothetical protein
MATGSVGGIDGGIWDTRQPSRKSSIAVNSRRSLLVMACQNERKADPILCAGEMLAEAGKFGLRSTNPGGKEFI